MPGRAKGLGVPGRAGAPAAPALRQRRGAAAAPGSGVASAVGVRSSAYCEVGPRGAWEPAGRFAGSTYLRSGREAALWLAAKGIPRRAMALPSGSPPASADAATAAAAAGLAGATPPRRRAGADDGVAHRGRGAGAGAAELTAVLADEPGAFRGVLQRKGAAVAGRPALVAGRPAGACVAPALLPSAEQGRRAVVGGVGKACPVNATFILLGDPCDARGSDATPVLAAAFCLGDQALATPPPAGCGTGAPSGGAVSPATAAAGTLAGALPPSLAL